MIRVHKGGITECTDRALCICKNCKCVWECEKGDTKLVRKRVLWFRRLFRKINCPTCGKEYSLSDSSWYWHPVPKHGYYCSIGN